MGSSHPRLSRLWREWLRPLALGAAIIFPMKSALADFNWVPSGSMEPTITPLEFVWVNKLAYDLKVPFTTHHLAEWGDPQRGDVAVFFSPADGDRLVKRVIGLPGDTIEMRDDRLILNGEPLGYADVTRDTHAPVITANEQLPGRPHRIQVLTDRAAVRTFGPLTVPPGHYFMLGDNRDNSHDSRFFGPVPRDQIVGRATNVIASFDLDRWACPRPSRFFTKVP
ncbi:MAG: signal peptidase I [Opitutaceae bacterium]|nr:signal peptidase I [Opitutaceae bacterium]